MQYSAISTKTRISSAIAANLCREAVSLLDFMGFVLGDFVGKTNVSQRVFSMEAYKGHVEKKISNYNLLCLNYDL